MGTVQLDYPMLHASASSTSARAKRAFFAMRGTLIGLLLLGAVSGLFPSPWSGWSAIAAFTSALYVEVASLRLQPEKRWHQSRAAAESVKTLAWRYSMAGAPFPLSLPAREVDALFLDRLNLAIGELNDVSLSAELGTASQITTSMRSLRAASLADREQAYEEGRLQAQIRWYVERAAHNSRWHDRFSLLSIALAALGLLFGILHTAGVLTVNLWSVVATGGAVTAGWSQTKQHGRNATTYARTAQELASIRARLRHVDNEAEWASFVEGAESAISREHSLWQASRSDSKGGP